MLAVVGAHVLDHVTIGEFDLRGFVGLFFFDSAKMPGRAVIVRIDDVRMIGLLRWIGMVGVIGGNQETTAMQRRSELNAIHGSGLIPAPMRLLYIRADIARL